MDVSYLVLADHADTPGNGKTYAAGMGWNMLTLPIESGPVVYGMFVCLGIDVDWNEAGKEHAFKLMVQDPDGAPLVTAEGGFRVETPPDTAPLSLAQRISIALPVQCEFAAPGPYAVVVEVNGDPVARTRFSVLAAPPQAA